MKKRLAASTLFILFVGTSACGGDEVVEEVCRSNRVYLTSDADSLLVQDCSIAGAFCSCAPEDNNGFAGCHCVSR